MINAWLLICVCVRVCVCTQMRALTRTDWCWHCIPFIRGITFVLGITFLALSVLFFGPAFALEVVVVGLHCHCVGLRFFGLHFAFAAGALSQMLSVWVCNDTQLRILITVNDTRVYIYIDSLYATHCIDFCTSPSLPPTIFLFQKHPLIILLPFIGQSIKFGCEAFSCGLNTPHKGELLLAAESRSLHAKRYMPPHVG